MSIWQTVTWNVARTGGFTAYLLLTLAVAVGLALTMRLQSSSCWLRLINSELHNFLTLLSVVFVGVHAIILQGTQESFGGRGSGLSITSTQVKLGQDAARPLYQGYLTNLRSNEIRWRMSALLSNVGAGTNKVQAQIEMQVASSGQVTE